MWFGTWMRMRLLGMSVLSDTTPVSESVSGIAGGGQKASRDDHKHPRLTSATWANTNSSGEATFAFTRSFSARPTVDLCYEEAADNQPVILKVKSWTQDGNGNYTGLIAKAYRLQTLPSSITLLTALVNFSVTVNAPAGIPVSCIALQQSS